MLKKFASYLLILFVILVAITSYAQEVDYLKTKGEVYFSFSMESKDELQFLTMIISIDNVDGLKVYAYANEKEFSEFLKLNYKYEILPHPASLIAPEMGNTIEDVKSWNVYPTYDAYVSMMNQFAANYPSICQLIDAGNTVQGRKILFVKISDNVSVREPEPQFMYTSSMHGDELTGYVLMLRLIDSLLTSYGSDPRITNLINNIEIWINPLANPDGAYYGGNSTVANARRFNANGYDLNRNFPDPINGVHSNQQIETTRFRTLQEANNFSLIANFHGGAEVVNYPWDRWSNVGVNSRVHADEIWYYFISRQYADTCHVYSPSNYMTYLNNGVTNGGAWYVITGGRQDYTNWYRWGREVTIEISNTKLPSASLLPNFWEYNKHSLLTYMENVLYGIRGMVTDHLGSPLKAQVTIVGHDVDNSQVYSDSATGFYLRMLAPGTYSLTFSAPGYISETVNNVVVENFSATNLNVQLNSINSYLLNITALIEGFFDGVKMKPDTLTVELRNSSSPYLLVEETKILVDSNGYGTAFLASTEKSASYFIVIKHRNSIETWSSFPQSFVNGVLTYDFTSGRRKAYGNNLVQKGNKWCIYSGDVNQDGAVEISDVISITNHATSYVNGTALVTDLDGDSWVDLSDIVIVVNNSNNFVSKQTP